MLSTLSCKDGFCNNAVHRGMKAIIMEADRNIRIICNSFASRGSSPSPEKNLIPYKNFNCIAQKSYYFTHFLIILCFFAMNTKYVRKNIEKPLRHILDVYIYHIYEVSSYCPPPLIKTPGSTADGAPFFDGGTVGGTWTIRSPAHSFDDSNF